MPYALFCNDAQLSNAYPTEADVWKYARQSGLVVDGKPTQKSHIVKPVLDNDYEIKPCKADSEEDPTINRAEAERVSQLEFKQRQ